MMKTEMSLPVLLYEMQLMQGRNICIDLKNILKASRCMITCDKVPS